MRVLTIFGSPRTPSNSEAVAESILKGIASKKAATEIQRVSLAKKKIKPCIACDGCQQQIGCVILDDMTELYSAFNQADLVVIASPIYFNSLNAQLKSLIDRCQAIWASKYILKKSMIDREKYRLGVLVATAGNPEGRAEFAPAKRVIDIFFKAINTQYFDELLVTDIDKSSVTTRPELLEAAFQLGQKMVTTYQKEVKKHVRE